jgi:hypothetical protein
MYIYVYIVYLNKAKQFFYMKHSASQFPLVKLPHKLDYCLFLIKEELKSQRFFEGLHNIGIEDIYFQPHLDKLILKCVGLDDGKDETAKFYFEVLERRCMKVRADNDSIVMQAVKVYVELMNEKKCRKEIKKEGKLLASCQSN